MSDLNNQKLDNKIEKEITRDMIKFINLLNIKLFSEEDSNTDTFFLEITEVILQILSY